LGFTDSGLAKDLKRLVKGEMLSRGPNGYQTTEKGREAVRKLTLTDEMQKQRLVKKLLVLQQLVRPSEILGFESLKTLLKQETLTLSRYEAFAVAEALEVSSNRQLEPSTAVEVYANAINLIGAAIEPGGSSCRVMITLDLNRGLDLVERRLENELQDEWDPERRRKLEAFVTQIRTRRPAVLQDIHKRFLKLKFP
jgi:hypothetical protein